MFLLTQKTKLKMTRAYLTHCSAPVSADMLPSVCLSAKHREGITLEHRLAPNQQSRTGRVRFCESECSGGDAITRVALVGGYRDDEATTHTPTHTHPYFTVKRWKQVKSSGCTRGTDKYETRVHNTVNKMF